MVTTKEHVDSTALSRCVDEKLSQVLRRMRGMKRIVLEIEMEEDSNVVTWRLDDWRGQVSDSFLMAIDYHSGQLLTRSSFLLQ